MRNCIRSKVVGCLGEVVGVSLGGVGLCGYFFLLEIFLPGILLPL